MSEREKIIEALERAKNNQKKMGSTDIVVSFEVTDIIIAMLKKQEPKTGHWIDDHGYDKCSVCGATYSDLFPDYQNTHYCPNCWAKMCDGGNNHV